MNTVTAPPRIRTMGWFLAYLPDPSSDVRHAEARRAEAFGKGAGALVMTRGCVLIAAGGNSTDDDDDAARTAILVQLTAGARLTGPCPDQIRDGEHLLSWDGPPLTGSQFFNCVMLSPHRVTLQSDPLGLLPCYVAKLSAGTVIASHLLRLFACFPELARPLDHVAALEYLTFGGPLGNRTLHAQVQRTPTGGVITWDRLQGFRISRTRRILPARRVAARTVAETGRAALHLLEQSIRGICHAAPVPVVVPLTGGYDSRLIAGVCHSLGIATKAVTLGHRRHREVRVARRIAKRLEMPFRLVTPANDLLDHVALWSETVEGQADSGTLFACHLLPWATGDAPTLLHGFLGDALTGAHLGWGPSEPDATQEELAEALVARFYRRRFLDTAGASFGLDANPGDICSDILEALPEGGDSNQRLMVWDLENRQRRLVASQLLFLGAKYRAAAPSYDPAIIQFWLAQPREALEGRRALHWMLNRVAPTLASIPHCEERPVRWPRNWDALALTASYHANRWAVRIGSLLGMEGHALQMRTYVWDLWHGTTPAQAEHQLDTMRNHRGLVSAVLGWDLPAPETMPWLKAAPHRHEHDRLSRRVYLLHEYCSALQVAVGAVGRVAGIDDSS